MPLKNLKCGGCGDVAWTVDQIADQTDTAPFEHFENAHNDEGYQVFGGSLLEIAKTARVDRLNERRQGAHLSASMSGMCVREKVLERTVEYDADPYNYVSALHGTLIHRTLSVEPWWLAELGLQPILIDGLKVDAVADRVRTDYTVVRDIKTHHAPKGRFVNTTKEEKDMGIRWRYSEGEKIFPIEGGTQWQVNIQRHCIEKEYGVLPVGQVQVIQLGCNKIKNSYRLLPVPSMDLDELAAAVGPDFKTFTEVMSEPDVTKRLDLAAKLPLQGLEMYKSGDGTCKCDRYCALSQVCAGLQSQERRF